MNAKESGGKLQFVTHQKRRLGLIVGLLPPQIFRLTNHLRKRNPKATGQAFRQVDAQVLSFGFNQANHSHVNIRPLAQLLLSGFPRCPVLSHYGSKVLRQIAFLHACILPLMERQYIAGFCLALFSGKGTIGSKCSKTGQLCLTCAGAYNKSNKANI